ncbi:MAG TPA: tetratricopeptide repeat protein [Spirochaetota bacterium]|nr:tetratricopeptide repeat protein [Spirochaetota bacterium]HOL57018.1 tetratricopeptide repeat protein [Spirochaetota bacterium]HPP04597.1 tetratricopeptide repeat protein [Spirochaetota bacterium]
MRKIVSLYFFLIFSCASFKTVESIGIDYFNLANEYFNLKNYPKAIEFYEKSLSYNKNIKEAKLNLILSYQNNKDFEKAENLIKKEYTERVDDFNKKLLLLLGNNYYLQGKYDIAIKVYKAYTDLYSDDINVFFNLALSYLKNNKEDEFVKTLFECYNLNNKFVPALFNIANYYFNKKDFNNALKYYKELIEVEKDNAEIYYRISLIQFEKEEFEDAKLNIDNAIKLNDKEPKFYLILAKIYAKAYKDKKNTVLAIENALKNGFNDTSYLNSQEEFLILKQFNDYIDLLKKYNLY